MHSFPKDTMTEGRTLVTRRSAVNRQVSPTPHPPSVFSRLPSRVIFLLLNRTELSEKVMKITSSMSNFCTASPVYSPCGTRYYACRPDEPSVYLPKVNKRKGKKSSQTKAHARAHAAVKRRTPIPIVAKSSCQLAYRPN